MMKSFCPTLQKLWIPTGHIWDIFKSKIQIYLTLISETKYPNAFTRSRHRLLLMIIHTLKKHRCL